MLRLAFVSTHPIQYFVPLYRAMAADPNIEVRVFYCSDFGVRASYDKAFGRTFCWDIPLTDGYDHVFLRNISWRPDIRGFFGTINPTAVREIVAFQPDAVIVNGYSLFANLMVMVGSLLNGIPILLRGDSNIMRPRPLWIRAIKRPTLGALFRTLAGALAVGTLNSRYYAHYGLPKEKIFLAPYTVDNDFFLSRREQASIDASALREELQIDQTDLVLLFAGKLYDIKAPLDLVQAFLSRDRPGVTLVIAGDGQQRRDIEGLVNAARSTRVKLLGFLNQTQMPTAYAMANLVVVPSRQEAWGLVINEAMNFGLPILASDQVGAVPDLVRQQNGWVFPAGDLFALKNTLDSITSDRESLRRKGLESTRLISHWGIPETTKGIVDAVQSVRNARGT